METHAYLQTRTDQEESDIDVGSSYYISQKHINRETTQDPISKDNR